MFRKNLPLLGAALGILICGASIHAQAVDPQNSPENQMIQLILNTTNPDVFLYSPDKPFTLKSGKISPIFMNFGNITSGKSISKLGDIYAQLIMEKNIQFDVIFASAYKGIPFSCCNCR